MFVENYNVYETREINSHWSITGVRFNYKEGSHVWREEKEDLNGERDIRYRCVKGNFYVFPFPMPVLDVVPVLLALGLSYFWLYDNVVLYLPARVKIEQVLKRLEGNWELQKVKSYYL